MTTVKGQKDLRKFLPMIYQIHRNRYKSLSIYAKTETKVAIYCRGRSPSKNMQVPNVPSPAVD